MLANERTYRRIKSESRRCEIGGDLTLAIPSPLHLIAMELHALRNAQRTEKGIDLLDVKHLIRTAKIDISSPGFVAILENYATDAIRREIECEFRSQPGS